MNYFEIIPGNHLRRGQNRGGFCTVNADDRGVVIGLLGDWGLGGASAQISSEKPAASCSCLLRMLMKVAVSRAANTQQ